MNFDPNLDYDMFRYPVFYQQQNGYLVFACPDLNISVATELPFKKRFDTKYAVKLSKAMLKVEIKIRERLLNMKKAGMKQPSPSKTKDVLSDKKIKRLTAPQIAKRSNGKYSVNTIRRMMDSGLIPCTRSNGKTRYALEKDLPDFI